MQTGKLQFSNPISTPPPPKRPRLASKKSSNEEEEETFARCHRTVKEVLDSSRKVTRRMRSALLEYDSDTHQINVFETADAPLVRATLFSGRKFKRAQLQTKELRQSTNWRNIVIKAFGKPASEVQHLFDQTFKEITSDGTIIPELAVGRWSEKPSVREITRRSLIIYSRSKGVSKPTMARIEHARKTKSKTIPNRKTPSTKKKSGGRGRKGAPPKPETSRKSTRERVTKGSPTKVTRKVPPTALAPTSTTTLTPTSTTNISSSSASGSSTGGFVFSKRIKREKWLRVCLINIYSNDDDRLNKMLVPIIGRDRKVETEQFWTLLKKNECFDEDDEDMRYFSGARFFDRRVLLLRTMFGKWTESHSYGKGDALVLFITGKCWTEEEFEKDRDHFFTRNTPQFVRIPMELTGWHATYCNPGDPKSGAENTGPVKEGRKRKE